MNDIIIEGLSTVISLAVGGLIGYVVAYVTGLRAVRKGIRGRNGDWRWNGSFWTSGDNSQFRRFPFVLHIRQFHHSTAPGFDDAIHYQVLRGDI